MKFLLTRMISLSRLWIEIWNAGRKKEMNLRLLHWCLTSPCLLRTFLSQSLLTQPRLLRQVLLLVWCQLVTVYSLCSNGKEMPECSSLDRVHTMEQRYARMFGAPVHWKRVVLLWCVLGFGSGIQPQKSHCVGITKMSQMQKLLSGHVSIGNATSRCRIDFYERGGTINLWTKGQWKRKHRLLPDCKR